MRGPLYECRCGASVIWGSLAADEEIAAWSVEHAAHAPVKLMARVLDETLVEDVSGAPMRAFVESMHAQGRIGGRMIEIVMYGTTRDPASAHAALDELKSLLVGLGAMTVETFALLEDRGYLDRLSPGILGRLFPAPAAPLV